MTRKTGKNKQVTRRQFMELTGIYSMAAVMGARAFAAEAGEAETYGLLKDKARQIELAQKKPEIRIRMGVSGDSPKVQENGFPTGYWEFARDLNERTDGRIEVQLTGGNALCTEISCAQKFSTNTIPAYGSSSQNASLTYPFLTALDFPFLFPTRASMHYFLYSQKGDSVFRKVLREKFDYEFLWSLAEGRALFMGKGWADRPQVRKPEDIKGAKLRVTASPMARISLDLLGANPIPLAWAETYEGLKSGVVDGMENFPSAAPAYGMTPAISQMVNLEFFSGLEHAAISRKFLEKLPDDLRDAVMESAFHTQQWTQQTLEKARVEISGMTEPPKPGTIFAKSNVAVSMLSAAERRVWEEMSSPEFHPKPYEEWRERLAKMAGGTDVYKEIYDIARELPADTKPEDVKPVRWWKA